ncbi:MAG: hypothetical protein K6T88_06765 [Bacillus sp. (in: Bacteria)]|nr:hypothetical protein [Bacillus sp. (in: firmicutes)]
MPPAMTIRDTTLQKESPILELKFKQLSIEGLLIKKIIYHTEGIVTIDITPKDAVSFDNVSLNVTNSFLSENYHLANGNIGLKNVKLMVHSVTTESSFLRKFNLSYDDGGQVEPYPKSEQEPLQP